MIIKQKNVRISFDELNIEKANHMQECLIVVNGKLLEADYWQPQDDDKAGHFETLDKVYMTEEVTSAYVLNCV